MRNGLNTLAWITLGTCYFIIGLIVYWSVYPYNPLTFKKPFEIKNMVVKQGGYLEYISDYCKNLELPSVISRSFINGIVYTTPSAITDRKSGCNQLTIGVHVPDELPPGKYHLEVVYRYEVNPIRTITVKNVSDEFYVTNEAGIN